MADVKISALTAATTPLAGTEVLPIVQSGLTVKVAVSDLTAGRAVALGATTITGAATISSTLGVTGTSTMAAINASGTVAMAGAATVGTTLGVTGLATFSASNTAFTTSAGLITITSSTGTNGSFTSFVNTGGTYYVGPTSSGGGAVITGGTSYALSIVAPSGRGIDFGTNGALAMKISSAGAVTIPGTLGVGNAGNSGIQLYVTATGTKYGLYVDGSSGVMLYSGINSQTFTSGESATNSALYVRKDSTSSRSISAAGTINASGADYAEYERKASLDSVFSKGAIVGFDENGLLTKTKAVSYGVKSTNPSYVGNDAWAADVGQRSEPLKDDATEEEKATHAAETEAFEARLESARQWVDRIAYSGKAPVNVMEASPGDLIVADNGGEAWDLTADASVPDWFKKYIRTVGRVRRILPDGRAEIAVYVH